MNRRTFLKSSAVLVAGTMAQGKVFGANDRINMGVIGLNGRGKEHMSQFGRNKNVELVALCDVDAKVLDRSVEAVTKARNGDTPAAYGDMRELFADESIDAVSIATPNHWHSLAAIWAADAGKHVYVEKPLSHNIAEGRKLVEASERCDKVIMHGTQRRSETGWLNTVQAMRDGIIGNLYMARALCYKPRGSIGTAADSQPPAHLNWELWQGPRPDQPYNEKYVHYNWHWFWDFGNGDIGNQGVHQMDVAVWGLGKGLPVKVYSEGGRYTYEDQGETPNTQTATFTYADGSMLTFEVRGRYTNWEQDTGIGNLFYGSDGYFVESDKGKQRMQFFDARQKPVDIPDAGIKTDGCWKNFINAVLSGKPEDNLAPAIEGHISSAHGHLANISYRLGRSLEFDPTTETFVNDDEANKMLTEAQRPGFEAV